MKNDTTQKDEVRKEIPFFARYLEGQDYPRIRTDVKVGCGFPGYHTCKWPSDGDDGGPTS